MSPRRRSPQGFLEAVLSVILATGLGGCHGVLTSSPPLPSPKQQSALPAPSEPVLRFPDTTGAPEETAVVDENTLLAQSIVEGWTLERQVASLFMVHVPGQDVADFQELRDQFPVGGFLILRDNVSRDQDQARDFLSRLRLMDEPSLLVAVDQEGGAVERLRTDTLPAAPELGEGGLGETTEAMRARNQLVLDSGANVNFGLVADVSPGPDSYIDRRSFGEDPKSVAAHVGAAVEGSVAGVGLAVKHFPGHGLTPLDTHRHLATSDISLDEWRRDHLPPFQVAIDQQIPIVMLSHIVVSTVDTVPTSLSSRWVAVLREELGFSGVVATDDLSMLEDTGESDYSSVDRNAVRALDAGVDLVVDAGALDASAVTERLATAINAVLDAVASGEIDQTQIESAAIRLLVLRNSLGGVPGPLDDAEVGEFGG